MKKNNDVIDSKFTVEDWTDLDKIASDATDAETIAKVNELIEYINYVMRFLIGKTD